MAEEEPAAAIATAEPRGYRTVRLLDKNAKIVRDLTIPPFVSPPSIILYGSRGFIISDQDGKAYMEATLYGVPFEDVD